MTFTTWLTSLEGRGPVLVLGLDPSPEILSAWGEPDSVRGLHRWSAVVAEEVVRLRIPCVKVQVAFFERHGIGGFTVLHELLGSLRAAQVQVIGDAKRGDISTTMEGYADAWLRPGGDFEVDSLTVNPYLGFGALEPALSLAEESGKGFFALAATSNPEAHSVQGATASGGASVAATIIHEVQQWRLHHPSSAAGVVVGATVDHDALGISSSLERGLPILAPGYGAQGALLEEVGAHFPREVQVLPVVARSVLRTGREGCERAWIQSLESVSSP